MAAIPVGVGIGFWAAQAWPPFPNCRPYGCSMGTYQPTFAVWQCALFGVVAAALMVVGSIAVRPSPR